MKRRVGVTDPGIWDYEMASCLEGGRIMKRGFLLEVRTPEEIQPLLGMLPEAEKLGRNLLNSLSFLPVPPAGGAYIEAC